MALEDFFSYLKANTPAESKIPQTELARQLWDGFNNNPQNTATKNSVVDMMTNSPVVGDLLSGLIGAGQIGKGLVNDISSINQPTAQDMVHQMSSSNYGEGALNLIGTLPLVPALGGVINIKGKGIAPPELIGNVVKGMNVLPSSSRYDAAGNLFEDLYAGIRPLQDGNYLGRYNPPWGSKSKDFYAVGDNIDELADYMLARKHKSDSAIESAQKQKESNSLIGQLKKQLGVEDSAFDFARSTQSKSQYFTYKPTGTKIRISNHSLPLHYDQPDVDLREWMSDEDKLQRILDAIK